MMSFFWCLSFMILIFLKGNAQTDLNWSLLFPFLPFFLPALSVCFHFAVSNSANGKGAASNVYARGDSLL